MTTIKLEVVAKIGETVYLKLDKDQLPRMVLKILATTADISYLLTSGTTESWHYGVEIAKEPNILTKIEQAGTL